MDTGQFGFEAKHFVGGHLAQLGIGILQHLPAFVVVVLDLFVLAILVDHFFDIAACLGGLAIVLRIADDGRIGHLAGQLIEPPLHIVESLRVLHGRLPV